MHADERPEALAGGAVPTAEPERSDLSSLVGRLAHAIDRELSPGDVAALRRFDADDPGGPAFWKLAATVLPDAVGEGPGAEELERRWAAIACGMALTSGQHAPGRAAGEALADAGFAELRFVRLLRAHGDPLLHALRTTARFLASKAIPLDWRDLAALVLSDGRSDEERVRRRIARSYYGQLSRNERT